LLLFPAANLVEGIVKIAVTLLGKESVFSRLPSCACGTKVTARNLALVHHDSAVGGAAGGAG